MRTDGSRYSAEKILTREAASDPAAPVADFDKGAGKKQLRPGLDRPIREIYALFRGTHFQKLFFVTPDSDSRPMLKN
jgi:hypothetical protein